MRFILIGILMLTFFEAPPLGCSLLMSKVPTEAYPEKVGKFKRDSLIGEQTKAVEADYLKESVTAPAPIHLEMNLANNEQDAKGYLELSNSECSAENLEFKKDYSKLLLDNNLMDKNGKLKGVIRVCKIQGLDFENYYLEMTNIDLVMRFATRNQVPKAVKMTLVDLRELVTHIPFNANLDFDSFEIVD